MTTSSHITDYSSREPRREAYVSWLSRCGALAKGKDGTTGVIRDSCLNLSKTTAKQVRDSI